MNQGGIILLVGFPASTKSTHTEKLLKKYSKRGVVLSRDTLGETVTVSQVEDLISQKKVVILDNTNMTQASRKPFIELAKKHDIPVECVYLKTTIEDCQIRALHRMYTRYNQVYLTGKVPKGDTAHGDPNVFPPATLFAARKKFEEPRVDEGFTKVTTIEVPTPKWDGRVYRNKALFLDIDGTIRKTKSDAKYPTDPDDIELLKPKEEMLNKLEEYRKKGYIIVGVSNQSGIASKKVTESTVQACFERTRELLGYSEAQFPILYCPHSAAPITCYCRKPQVGMALSIIEQKRVNPAKSIMVGDLKTDETMAKRLGINYIDVSEFWV